MQAEAIRGRRQRRGPEEDVMASWRGVCGGTVLAYARASLSWTECACRSHAPRGIDGGLCACEWVEGEEEEAGISNVNEWVAAVALRMCGWSGGWPGPNLFLTALACEEEMGAIHEKR